MYSGMYTKYVCNLKQINFQQLKNCFFKILNLCLLRKKFVLDEDSARQKEQ